MRSKAQPTGKEGNQERHTKKGNQETDRHGGGWGVKEGEPGDRQTRWGVGGERRGTRRQTDTVGGGG